jgi:integrase
MRAPSYILQSRHGIFYFRIRIPSSPQKPLDGAARELRVSLHTRNKKVAIYMARKRWIEMQDKYNTPSPWEEEGEAEFEKYKRGKYPLAQHPGLDPHRQFDLDELHERLSNEDLAALIFAFEHDVAETKKQQQPSSPDLTPETTTPKAAAPSYEEDDSLDEALKRFLKSRDIAQSSLKSYAAKCNTFSDIVTSFIGSKTSKMSQLDAKVIRHYSDEIRKRPKRQDAGKKSSASATLPSETISPKTVQSHIIVVKSFLDWAEGQHYPLKPNLERILVVKKVKSVAKRRPFEPSELQAIFLSDKFRLGTFTRASDYWVPLLGLLTDARESELCQLHTEDIKQDRQTKLWVIDINDDDDKRLKTPESSKRRVPIHVQLKRLGFLDFVEDMKAQGSKRLFPDEQRNSTGEFSAFSKRFNRFKEALGVKRDDKRLRDFHCFRHGVSDYLVANGHQQYVINAILGHAQAKESQSVSDYSSGPGLKAVNDLVQTLTFDVDFNQIEKNGWHKKLKAKGPTG